MLLKFVDNKRCLQQRVAKIGIREGMCTYKSSKWTYK